MKKCIVSCLPLIVCEYNSQHWFVCPCCQNAIDREYVAYCSCCGQKLSWYGSVSRAHLLGEKLAETQPKHHSNALSAISQTEDQSREIEAEINLLKKKISEKRTALKKLKFAQEEKKKAMLAEAIAQSGKSIDDLINMLEKLEA